MAQGWIKLHRKICQCTFWKEKPFDRARAWIDLLLLANHDDDRTLFGKESVEVKRGSLVVSESMLMERWGWSKTKLRSFLTVLERAEMIVKKTDRTKTTISIVNYGFYQDFQTAGKPRKIPQEDRKKTADSPVESSFTGIFQTDGNTTEDTTERPLYKKNKEYIDVSYDTSGAKKFAPAEPGVKRIIDYYFQKFVGKFGEKPVIDGKKDGAIIKRLLRTYGEEKLKGLIDRFFESTDLFIVSSGYTIGVFKTQINKLIAESRQRPPPPNGTGLIDARELAAIREKQRGKKGDWHEVP